MIWQARVLCNHHKLRVVTLSCRCATLLHQDAPSCAAPAAPGIMRTSLNLRDSKLRHSLNTLHALRGAREALKAGDAAAAATAAQVPG